MTVITEPMDTMTIDTMTMDSQPEISDEAERLGEELITCISGDADPALVTEALEVISADEETTDVGLACVESVLTALDDETLQAIIDGGIASVITDSMGDVASMDSQPDATTGTSDAVAGTDVSVTDEDSNTFLLYLCIPDIIDMDMNAGTDTGTADTVSAGPATSDTATGDSASDY